VWGNSVGSLDPRIDMKNLPESFGWPGKGYVLTIADDWSSYRYERGQILDYLKTNGITGLTSVCGDRHCFQAGVLSKSLPPETFEPVAVEFVGASISSPGGAEATERMKDENPMRPLYVRRHDGVADPTINMTITHGVRSSLEYDKTGDLKAALALSNPEVAPHMAFADLGAHGYSVVRATADALETEFVCIPPPIERSTTDDGGPLRYRVLHRAKAWQPGEKPVLEQTVLEGKLPLT
ncbi:MAG: alkaline phosphatase D family protein, partial [Alphaproteobacteria bacterium]|nr:alkaline phosphatase D family protein [Alphaproteobacteria bacterium]